MHNIANNISHSKSSILYAFSYFFERASYYGIRSIIILYLVGESLNFPYQEALAIYGWVALFILITKFIGAFLGDLLKRNRVFILVGGVLQTLGCFLLCIESTTSLYVGLGLITFGSGLFTSNTLAQFGKQYLNKPKLLDAGFTVLFMGINFGSFLGVLAIGYVGGLDFKYGFLMAGVLTIISTVLVLFTNGNEEFSLVSSKSVDVGKKLIYIVSVIIISAIFWMAYEVNYFYIYKIQEKVFEGITIVPETYFDSGFGSYFGVIIILILAFTWSYIYTNSFFKLFLGLIVSAISFVVLLCIPDMPNSVSLILFLVSSFLLALGEMLISPILFSITTRFSNPKYLAIMLALVTIPSFLFYRASGLIGEHSHEINSNMVFGISVFVLSVFGVLAYVLSTVSRRDDRIYLSKETEEFLS